MEGAEEKAEFAMKIEALQVCALGERSIHPHHPALAGRSRPHRAALIAATATPSPGTP